MQANNQSKKYFKIITIPNTMPYETLRGLSLKIGFDPNLITKKTLSIFFGRASCEFKPVTTNLIDKIWKRKIKKKKKIF